MSIEKSQLYSNAALMVIETEAAAIQALAQRINHNFVAACELLQGVKGHIIVTGVGKSGHIGRKIAATFASTGSPAFYVHPTEVGHGDFGMITPDDVILAISNSGTNDEIILWLPLLKRSNIPLIALTGNLESPLAEFADIVLDISVLKEACPLGLAPTASTTASLVMGDALAMALIEGRGFTIEDFAFSHPGGRLGKTLILRVGDIMHVEEELPLVIENNSIVDAIIKMNEKNFGCVFVVNQQKELRGIFTNGDLQRTFLKDIDLKKSSISEVMSPHCKTIEKTALAVEALNKMQKHKITVLAVLDKEGVILGLIHLHDLLKHGIT